MLYINSRTHINLLYFFITFIILIFAPIVEAENGKKIPFFISDEEDYPDSINLFFDSCLQGKTLKFYSVKTGMDIPLNSIIVMPSFGKKGFLSIEFKRVEVNEKFIRDLFYGEDKNVTKIHPFAYNGIEPILTKDKLILNIYSGVGLHLRNDMNFSPNYKTFKSDNVVGKVIQVKGKVFCSSDRQLLKERLNDVFVWIRLSSVSTPGSKTYKLPDGSYTGTIPFDDEKDLPRYKPKIIEEDKEK